MSAPAGRRKPRVPWYWWPLWAFLLAVGLIVFYVLFTPVWVGIRFAAWLSERTARTIPSRPAREQ